MMMRLLLVAVCLVLSACADGRTSLFEGWEETSAQPPAPEPLVGFVIDNGEPVNGVGQMVFKLNMARAELIYPFLTMADDEGFYNGLPIHRAVPGLVAEVGDGYWTGKESRRFPTNKDADNDVMWASNLLAVKVNDDGTMGPGVFLPWVTPRGSAM